MNRLYLGDNLHVLAEIAVETVDLVYLAVLKELERRDKCDGQSLRRPLSDPTACTTCHARALLARINGAA